MVAGLSADFALRRGELRLELALAVRPGEVVALVGPNGAGKSTALRALDGLLAIERGEIVVGEQLLARPPRIHLAPYERPIGVVFQDYLLFPHLDVLDNVAFGPRCAGLSRAAGRTRAWHWLERLGIAELADRRPRQLSGGQAQRVALARALAIAPSLLLLDEPLAALDARTRVHVRSELRRSLRDLAPATLLVTHDPVDAAVLADRLVVLEDGRVVQEGVPAEVTRRPRTDYVARLVGLNLVTGAGSGRTVALGGGGLVHVAHEVAGECAAVFRPAAVSLFTAPPSGSPRNVWPGAVAGVEPHGDGIRVAVAGAPGPGSSLVAEITAAALDELELRLGSPVWAGVKASDVEVYPV